MATFPIWRWLLSGCLLLLLTLAGCSSFRETAEAPVTEAEEVPLAYPRPHQDGAPWWEVDVSQIVDATPTPHYGPVKAAPYTVLGQTYYPFQDAQGYVAMGIASWYGTKFHGQATANGEKYDLYGMTAAHKTLPLPSYVRVTNLDNNRSVVVRVNDRGPFHDDRLIDLSFAAAKKLGYAERGTAPVRVESIDPHQWLSEQGQVAPVTQAVQAVEATPVVTAAAVSPLSEQPVADSNSNGYYLQVGAFANADAAELLRSQLVDLSTTPVFVSSVVREQQVLHRVRLGPISSTQEALQLERSIRLANLGNPRRVVAD